jgi:hypothetical protein
MAEHGLAQQGGRFNILYAEHRTEKTIYFPFRALIVLSWLWDPCQWRSCSQPSGFLVWVKQRVSRCPGRWQLCSRRELVALNLCPRALCGDVLSPMAAIVALYPVLCVLWWGAKLTCSIGKPACGGGAGATAGRLKQPSIYVE